jgi:hypothetical protein
MRARLFAGDEMIAVAARSGAAASTRIKSMISGVQRGRPTTGYANASAKSVDLRPRPSHACQLF